MGLPTTTKGATTMDTIRYALRTAGTNLYIHDLQRYTMPSACEGVGQAKTWASVRGAMAAAKRHGLTNVEAVAVRVPKAA